MLGHNLNTIFTAICFIMFCGLLIETFEPKRDFGKVKRFGVIVASIGIIIVCVKLLYPYVLIKQVAILAVLSISMCILFQGKFWRIFLFSVLFHVICALSDCLVFWMISLVAMRVKQIQVTMPVQQFMMSVLSQMVTLFCIIVIKRAFGKEKTLNLSIKEWLQFSIVMMISIACNASLFAGFGILQDEKQGYLLLGIAIGILCMNLLVLSLLRGITRRESQIKEAQLFQEQVRNETTMYRTISENYNKQRKREHEYLNHMMCITALCQDEKLEDLKNYLTEVNQENVEQMEVYDTNHPIVNAILNVKYREARERGIVFVIIINDLSKLFLTDEDIVIILSNLLNNAFEACEKCTDKTVKLKFVQEEDQIIISAINTYKEEPLKLGTAFRTSKENVEEHGIGIENIKETVEKYNGSYKIQYEKGEFMFSILIPCQ